MRIVPWHAPPGDAGDAISNHDGPNRPHRNVSTTAYVSRPTPMIGKMKPTAAIGLRSPPEERPLLAVDGEGEEDIPGRAARSWIAGVEDHQTTTDGRTRAVDRSAAALASVDRVIRADGVEVP